MFQRIGVCIGLTAMVLLTSLRCTRSQEITWNGQVVRNNSLVTLSVVPNRVSSSAYPYYPLVCQGITGGQWYEPSGVLFPLATPDPVSTPGGYGQRNVSGGVELYCGTSDVFPHGVQCCTNTTITLCVGMYSDLKLAAVIYLSISNGYNYGLSVAATYGPNITGGVQFQLLTPTNVDPPVFQLTCTSTSSPPTDVLWTTNGSPVSNTSSQIVTDRPTSTYNNILTVTGRAYGMYTCTVTTTCSPVCGATGFTLNPRSTTSSLTVQAPPDPPTGVTAMQSGPTSVSVSWTAPTSGGPVTRYDIYYVANGGPSTSGGSTNSTSYVLTNLQVGVQYNISVIAVGTSLPSQSALSSVVVVVPGQEITWNGQVVGNNSLVTLSVVPNRVSSSAYPYYPLVCQGITGGQWYEPSGVLFPLATPDPVSTPGGLGQRNVSGGVELYRGTPSVFPHGVQCCTNTTITLCVGMYSDLKLAASANLATSNGYNYNLSVAATYGPNITGDVQFQLLTPTNVDPPVFQLTCTSTSSPPTDVLWTTNGSPVSNTSSQIVTDRPTSTYNNILTVTGRAYGMYTCTVTTTCSPVCGATGFTLNPRSTTSSLTVQAPPGPPTGVTAMQSGPTSVSVSWTAPTSGGPVTRYDIYYVANGGPSTSGGSTNSTSYVLTNLQVGVQYNISVIAVGTSLPSQSALSSVVVVVPGQEITWNGQVVGNNSLVTLSVVPNRVSSSAYPYYPLVCQGITGGQWYEPSGVLFPLATPDPVSTPGGLGQRNVSGGVELYRGTPSVFPHGVQCCTNTTITLCVGMYSDLKLAASANLATSNGYNYNLSVAATYGPNITGGVQFQLLTPTNVDPPVFQLTCTSTSSPPTDVRWTTNGSPVSNTSSQIVTDRPTSTYNNTLTVTGRAYGMSTTSSLTVEAPPGPPTGVTGVQSGPTSVSVSWTAPTSGGPVTRYDIYYVANGGPSTSGGSTNSTSYVLTSLQDGILYNISVIAVGTSLPSLSVSSSVVVVPGPSVAPGSSMVTGAIAGAVIGGILSVLLVVAVILFITTLRSKRKGMLFIGINSLDTSIKKGKSHDMELTSIDVTENVSYERPINVVSFHDHVHTMHMNGNKGFQSEYCQLSDVKPEGASQTVASLACNARKNRFGNIVPCDENRVKLKETPGVPGSDYINASHINGYQHVDSYIASQGPKENTIADFWRMIWEKHIETIVMLTKCTEASKNLCKQYWADEEGGVYDTDTLCITTTSVVTLVDYNIRRVEVKSKVVEDLDVLQVTHYQYTSWPDDEVPQFATSFLNFVRRVQKVHDKSKGVPLLVHCSTGVGRTGTFIALDTLLDTMRSETSISVFEVVKDMRRRRVLMVQTLAQYVFIHDALDEYITCGDTSIGVTNLRVSINYLSKTISGKTFNGYREQFSLLDMVSGKPSPDECSDGAQPYNKAKNRYENKLPYNASRPLLTMTGTEGSDYINASFIDGYKQCKGYIATQGPLQNTVEDFWRMVWEFKCRVIVMLCPLTEKGHESSYCYWPTEEEMAVSYGSISVTLQSQLLYGGYEVRTFNIRHKSEEQDIVVTQLHFTEWPENGRPPNTASMVELMDTLTRTQMSTGNKLIVVHCNDGVGRTGTFITMHSELERLKAEGALDVFQRVKLCRIARPGLVQNVCQYVYCHELLAHNVNQQFDVSAMKSS
eukprot:Em0011g1057a